MESLKLNEFDIMGMFTLSDVSGIEKYVTKISGDQYLSRASAYYGSKSCTKLSKMREQLKTKLTNENSKKNFVILENMLNCSAKVFYLELEKKILNKNEPNNFELAKSCLDEDAANIVSLLDGKSEFVANHILPQGKKKCLTRLIEMDNKALLYVFCKSIVLDKKYDVLVPGYGATLIGPFFKAAHDFEYTNLLKSKYTKDKNQSDIQSDDIKDCVSNPDIINPGKDILLLDDNVGTGETMKDIKGKLEEYNASCICGGIQYNWINYHRFTLGEKDTRFNISEFDIITPFNYPGHKLLDHSIKHLKKSGKRYIKYLKSKNYRQEQLTDMQSLIARSEKHAKKEGLDLYNSQDMRASATTTIRTIKHVVDKLAEYDEPVTSKSSPFVSDLSIPENEFITKLQTKVIPLDEQISYATQPDTKQQIVDKNQTKIYK